MQRFRGKIYVQDGAVSESSLIDGRHRADADFASWHLLVLNSQGRVSGCARFHEHPKPVVPSDLSTSRSALAKHKEWGGALMASLKEELQFSADVGLPFVELGGWALSEEIRGSTEAIRIALATYAFWQMLGEAVCISTVTHRHCAASILHRIGGLPLAHQGTELPPYHDPQYNCTMEILRFYSWAPNPRYALWIQQMKQELSRASMIVRSERDLCRRDIGQPFRMAHSQVA